MASEPYTNSIRAGNCAQEIYIIPTVKNPPTVAEGFRQVGPEIGDIVPDPNNESVETTISVVGSITNVDETLLKFPITVEVTSLQPATSPLAADTTASIKFSRNDEFPESPWIYRQADPNFKSFPYEDQWLSQAELNAEGNIPKDILGPPAGYLNITAGTAPTLTVNKNDDKLYMMYLCQKDTGTDQNGFLIQTKVFDQANISAPKGTIDKTLLSLQTPFADGGQSEDLFVGAEALFPNSSVRGGDPPHITSVFYNNNLYAIVATPGFIGDISGAAKNFDVQSAEIFILRYKKTKTPTADQWEPVVGPLIVGTAFENSATLISGISAAASDSLVVLIMDLAAKSINATETNYDSIECVGTTQTTDFRRWTSTSNSRVDPITGESNEDYVDINFRCLDSFNLVAAQGNEIASIRYVEVGLFKGYMYAITTNGIVLKSKNDGKDWAKVYSFPGDKVWVDICYCGYGSVLQSAADRPEGAAAEPTIGLMAVTEDAVFYSGNNGVKWHMKATSNRNGYSDAIWQDFYPTDPGDANNTEIVNWYNTGVAGDEDRLEEAPTYYAVGWDEPLDNRNAVRLPSEPQGQESVVPERIMGCIHDPVEKIGFIYGQTGNKAILTGTPTRGSSWVWNNGGVQLFFRHGVEVAGGIHGGGNILAANRQTPTYGIDTEKNSFIRQAQIVKIEPNYVWVMAIGSFHNGPNSDPNTGGNTDVQPQNNSQSHARATSDFPVILLKINVNAGIDDYEILRGDESYFFHLSDNKLTPRFGSIQHINVASHLDNSEGGGSCPTLQRISTPSGERLSSNVLESSPFNFLQYRTGIHDTYIKDFVQYIAYQSDGITPVQDPPVNGLFFFCGANGQMNAIKINNWDDIYNSKFPPTRIPNVEYSLYRPLQEDFVGIDYAGTNLYTAGVTTLSVAKDFLQPQIVDPLDVTLSIGGSAWQTVLAIAPEQRSLPGYDAIKEMVVTDIESDTQLYNPVHYTVFPTYDGISYGAIASNHRGYSDITVTDNNVFLLTCCNLFKHNIEVWRSLNGYDWSQVLPDKTKFPGWDTNAINRKASITTRQDGVVWMLIFDQPVDDSQPNNDYPMSSFLSYDDGLVWHNSKLELGADFIEKYRVSKYRRPAHAYSSQLDNQFERFRQDYDIISYGGNRMFLCYQLHNNAGGLQFGLYNSSYLMSTYPVLDNFAPVSWKTNQDLKIPLGEPLYLHTDNLKIFFNGKPSIGDSWDINLDYRYSNLNINTESPSIHFRTNQDSDYVRLNWKKVNDTVDPQDLYHVNAFALFNTNFRTCEIIVATTEMPSSDDIPDVIEEDIAPIAGDTRFIKFNLDSTIEQGALSSVRATNSESFGSFLQNNVVIDNGKSWIPHQFRPGRRVYYMQFEDTVAGVDRTYKILDNTESTIMFDNSTPDDLSTLFDAAQTIVNYKIFVNRFFCDGTGGLMWETDNQVWVVAPQLYGTQYSNTPAIQVRIPQQDTVEPYYRVGTALFGVQTPLAIPSTSDTMSGTKRARFNRGFSWKPSFNTNVTNTLSGLSTSERYNSIGSEFILQYANVHWKDRDYTITPLMDIQTDAFAIVLDRHKPLDVELVRLSGEPVVQNTVGDLYSYEIRVKEVL